MKMMLESYVSYCEGMVELRRRGEWKQHAATFAEYAAARFSLSKTRVELICKFVALRRDAQAAGLALPETPEQVAPLLALPRKRWLEAWELVLDVSGGEVTARTIQGVFERFGICVRRRVPPHILRGIRVRRAAKALAAEADGEALALELGRRGLGRHWDDAVRVVIDADQTVRTEAGLSACRRA